MLQFKYPKQTPSHFLSSVVAAAAAADGSRVVPYAASELLVKLQVISEEKMRLLGSRPPRCERSNSSSHCLSAAEKTITKSANLGCNSEFEGR
ncbi:hypothetical protein V2J09_004364 [Rumex salicifolius]